VNVEALVLNIHHIIDTELICRQYRLRLGRVEPVSREDHIDTATVRSSID